MVIDAAHRRWWQIFEVVFGVPFLVALGLQYVLPYSLPFGGFAAAALVLGVAFITVGTSFVVLARRELARHKQPTDPGQPTSEIITTGVFSFSRNPLYLGGICIVVGIALAFNLTWVLVLLLPTLIGCHYMLVVPEERYLAAKFGKEYRRYAASVYRWIGRAWRV